MAGEKWSEPTVTDDDRLPWLETAADDDEGAPLGRVVGMVLVGLVVLAAVLGGIYWFKHRVPGRRQWRPDRRAGRRLQGQARRSRRDEGGGRRRCGGRGERRCRWRQRIDRGRRACPEAPITGTKAAPDAKGGPGSSTATASVSGPGGKLTAPPPGRPVTVSGGGGGGALVQLGSFPTEAGANTAWAQASKRFGYLAGLGKSIEKAEVNGRTFYRLKVNAGSAGAAQDLCGKLKVAGEACIVTN